MASRPRSRKLAFVTVGATASFDELIRACLNPLFLSGLSDRGYTDLLLQYGKDRKSLVDELAPPDESTGIRTKAGLKIAGFSRKREGLQRELLSARAAAGTGFDVVGVVITHGGTGTILEGLRLGVPLVVVPNERLLDNHQLGLAQELHRQKYVVHAQPEDLAANGGAVDEHDALAAGLVTALDASHELRNRHKVWPPVDSDEETTSKKKTMAQIMDEEVGYTMLD